MQLLRTLSEAMAALRDTLSASERLLYDDLVNRLATSGVVQSALKVGDRFPDFVLPDEQGHFFQSSDLLRRGPLVVSFYRGRWCPFCTAALEAMAASLPAFSAAGATVVGITPEIGTVSSRKEGRSDFRFQMLCDLDNGLALECGVLFRPTDEIIRDYLADGLDLTQTNGNGSWFLPIPASYVVVPNGSIVYAYVNPDFRYRIEPQEMLRVVTNLKLD